MNAEHSPTEQSFVTTITGGLVSLFHAPEIRTAVTVLVVTTLHAVAVIVRRRFVIRRTHRVRRDRKSKIDTL